VSSIDDGGTSNAPTDDVSADTPSTQPGDDASLADDASLDDVTADPCTVVAPDTCPTAVPSFANDVMPILNARCNGCHTGAAGEPWALTNHADVEAWALSISFDLTRCTMPPADAGADLTKAELAAVLGWIVCGAPDN
jgi:hypothetical protein